MLLSMLLSITSLRDKTQPGVNVRKNDDAVGSAFLYGGAAVIWQRFVWGGGSDLYGGAVVICMGERQ